MNRNNKINKMRNKRRNINRRKNNIRRFHLSRYPNSQKPATFGPGNYFIAASKFYNGRIDSQITFNLATDIIQNNPELDRVRSEFKYMKLCGITITFYPRNIFESNNSEPAFFLINWDGATTENIRLQDNTKTVPSFLTRTKIFKFNIPRYNTYGGMLNGWFGTSELTGFQFILFQFFSASNTTKWMFKVDAMIHFKGPTNVTAKQEIIIKGKAEETSDATLQ